MFLKKSIAYIIFFIIPLLFVIVGVFVGYFGIEFTKEVMHCFGQISLWLLILMLCSKYLSKIPILGVINKYKKEIGISSFLFALFHIVIYVLGVSSGNIILEIIQRRYILLGFLLFVLMFLMFIFSFFNQKIFFKISPLLLPFSLFGAIHYLFSTKIVSVWAVVGLFLLLVLLCVDNLKITRRNL